MNKRIKFDQSENPPVNLFRPFLFLRWIPAESKSRFLLPYLLNMYTADIPVTKSRKLISSDDIALATLNKKGNDLSQTETTCTDDSILTSVKSVFQIVDAKGNLLKT